jgi:aliphatic nitrilase
METMILYPAYKVAAAHVAPVFLDTDRSIAKACSVIEEAAGHAVIREVLNELVESGVARAVAHCADEIPECNDG